MDVNGDGNISYVEQNVATINNNSTKPVNYDYGYLSYSIGANYMIKNNLAIFARHSTGGRANADRLLFGPFILPNGKAADGLSADMVTQTELGVKYRNANYFVNATAFLSNVEEQNYEATTQKSVNRVYGATGLELEGGVVVKGFELRGGLTFTQAEIKEDELDSTKIGNTPRRQAPVIFSIVPMYRFKKHSIGISVIGTGKSFAQDDNKLVMPGYAYFNPFINLAVTEKLGLSININNLTDQIGVTESEEGSITENAKNVVRARSITGRTVSATLRYNF
jgi:outer membrane receptor protein involved in Fe transport